MSKPTACFLSRSHVLLLQAALLSGKPAIEAWQEWRAATDLDSADAQSLALLPLLYHNLLAMDVTDVDMGRLAGVARSAWAGNQLLFHAGASAVAVLRQSAVDALVTDAAALALLSRVKGGLRRLSCFELLVRLRDARKAIAVLTNAGWQMEPLHPPLDAVLAFRDSALFQDAQRQALRLTWRLWETGGADSESLAWEKSIRVSVDGLRALSPTDLLLRACAVPERWVRDPSPAWIADAWIAIHVVDGIDWLRFVAQAEHFHLCLPASDALECLRDAFNAVVPTDAVQQLRSARTSRMERAIWRAGAKGSTVRGRLSGALHRYALLTRDQSWARRAGAFPAYLQCRWNLRSAGQVPGHALLKTTQAIGRKPCEP